MNKVAFFFGAGAETSGFNLSSGWEYLQSSLFPENAYFDALKEFYSSDDGLNRYFKNGYFYRKDSFDITDYLLKNFIIKKCTQSREFFEANQDTIKKILPQTNLETILTDLGIADLIESPKRRPKSNKMCSDIKKSFRKIVTGEQKYHRSIRRPFLQQLFSAGSNGEIIFDFNVGLAGVLDSYFHNIIDPNRYSKAGFSRVVNFYWSCYFTILKDILVFLSIKGYSQFDKYLTKLQSSKDEENINKCYKLKYSEVLHDLESLTKLLYDIDLTNIIPHDSYYDLISTIIKNDDMLDCKGVITTNYYRFCEAVSDNTIYLNGQIKLFELPEVLEVVDLSSASLTEEDKKLFVFPFIFGQSLVKPIVSSSQTEEFHKMHKLLFGKEIENGREVDSIDTLVILGYNINDDDNHINAFLHDYVKNGKRLIIFTDNENFDIETKLRLMNRPSNVELHVVDYNGDSQQNVISLFEKIKSGC